MPTVICLVRHRIVVNRTKALLKVCKMGKRREKIKRSVKKIKVCDAYRDGEWIKTAAAQVEIQ